jgi:hypothetical protein
MKHSFGFLTAVVLAWALPAVSVRSAESAPAAAVQSPQPWFDSVAAPAVMAEPFWFRLALDLHAALMAGKLDGANFLKTLPPDSAPRVLFLSWQSDPAKPAVVVFAAGKGVRAAAANALQKALVSGAGKPVTGLKVDVVQHRLNLGLFLRSTPLPLPGLIGLAFVPTAVDTAFLPEELLYGDLLTPARFLDVYAVTSGLQGAKDQARLEAWRPISVSRMPAPVSFFETYALYTDGTAVQPMFRGHLLPEPATVKSLRLAAGESAGFLRRNWGQTGVFAVPGWISGLGDHETAADLAAATLALLDWNALAPEAATADTAQRAVRSLQERLKPMACEPGALMVAEEFHTALDANALTVLVLCRAAAASGTPAAFTDSLMRLGAHLLRQVQPDGTFAGDRYYPSGNIRPTPAARETAAMAVTALVALYEQTGQRAFLDQAGKSLRILIEDASRTRGGVDMPPPPPGWLLVAINAYYTFDRDPTLLTAVERLSLAIRLTQVMDPVFPDGLGGFDNGQAVGAASSRVLGLLAAADLLGDSRKRAAVADSTLSAAHLGLLYLRQSQFDAAAAMYLADPAVCRGAFRLGLSGTVMTLRAQADGLMCLTAATRLALKSGETRPLPLADSARRVLARAREQVATFPRCLPPTVPEENTVPIEELTKPGPAPTTTLIKGEPRPTRAPRPTGK